MMTLLEPSAYLDYLLCPVCLSNERLLSGKQEVCCPNCSAVFPIRNSIIEFVIAADLDQDKLRELRGNTLDLTPEIINQYANKDEWSDYYSHISKQRLRAVANYIMRSGSDKLVSLGSGTGYELKELLSLLDLKLALSSDLSYTATSIVPHTLKRFNIMLGLFTSDLDRCPLRNKEIPILVFEALHHTADMHASIERLLAAGYKYMVFAEPSGNWLIRWLAQKGYAQRVEYSGVKPGRLDIGWVDQMCLQHGYNMDVITSWHFPDDYFYKLFGKSRLIRKLFLAILDLISAVTRPFRFGNIAVVCCRKQQ